MSSVPFSILDLAAVGREETIAESFAGSVELARAAERSGYSRVWYAEHHNIRSIASSATAVLIAHIAAHTETIRLGAGGVMLPNHSPLVIAEQFGTLATLHPGRIDLGLGRAPGSDEATFRALRRNHAASERFPEDVVELQKFLGTESPIPGVRAIPGYDTRVPLYILGSSLFGAQLAASLGLPYAFASHFAPQALEDALAVYRERFQPSGAARVPLRDRRRRRRRRRDQRGGRGAAREDAPGTGQVDLQPRRPAAQRRGRRGAARLPQAAVVDEMLTYTAVGTGAEALDYLDRFQRRTGADELITVHYSDKVAGRIRSVELLAEARAAAPVSSLDT